MCDSICPVVVVFNVFRHYIRNRGACVRAAAASGDPERYDTSYNVYVYVIYIIYD
jgi:hypothetical protein